MTDPKRMKKMKSAEMCARKFCLYASSLKTFAYLKTGKLFVLRKTLEILLSTQLLKSAIVIFHVLLKYENISSRFG